MAHRVDMINENYETTVNFVNTRERIGRNLLIIDDELSQQLLLLS